MEIAVSVCIGYGSLKVVCLFVSQLPPTHPTHPFPSTFHPPLVFFNNNLGTDEEGQFYEPHHDYIPLHRERFPGVRILTVFLYLNNVEEGGGTDFPRLGLVSL